MSSDADADRVVQAVLESGDRPLRSVLGAMDRGASGKAKQLMEQLDGQLRVICVPGRSSKSIASEILHVTRICASSLSKVLGKQKSEKLVGCSALSGSLVPYPLLTQSFLYARCRTRHLTTGKQMPPMLCTIR